MDILLYYKDIDVIKREPVLRVEFMFAFIPVNISSGHWTDSKLSGYYLGNDKGIQKQFLVDPIEKNILLYLTDCITKHCF